MWQLFKDGCSQANKGLNRCCKRVICFPSSLTRRLKISPRVCLKSDTTCNFARRQQVPEEMFAAHWPSRCRPVICNLYHLLRQFASPPRPGASSNCHQEEEGVAGRSAGSRVNRVRDKVPGGHLSHPNETCRQIAASQTSVNHSSGHCLL